MKGPKNIDIDTILGTLYRDANYCGQGKGDELPPRTGIINTAKAQIEALIKQRCNEAQLQILRGFRRRDFTSDIFYESAILDRIAALRSQDNG